MIRMKILLWNLGILGFAAYGCWVLLDVSHGGEAELGYAVWMCLVIAVEFIVNLGIGLYKWRDPIAKTYYLSAVLMPIIGAGACLLPFYVPF